MPQLSAFVRAAPYLRSVHQVKTIQLDIMDVSTHTHTHTRQKTSHTDQPFTKLSGVVGAVCL